MKVVKVNNLKTIINHKNKPLIVIWGFFDGWHLGHLKLLKQMQELAKKHYYQTLVISFDNKPQSVLANKVDEILLSNEDKIAFLASKKIDYYWQLTFSKQFAKNSADDFVLWLIKNNVQAVVVAKDVHFGNSGQGNLTTLQKSQLQVFISQDIFDENHKKISSSYIKQLLKAKNIVHANKLLNNNFYTITGKVVDGIKEGRILGFRTANLNLTNNYLIPGFGVYITMTEVNNKWYQSLTVIFVRNHKPLVETYLLDFNQDIYGQIIKVKFLDYLRDNIHFTNKEDLIVQIKKDVVRSILYFKKNKW